MTNYLILALATYRLSSLLSTEAGPLSLLERFRRLVGVAQDDHGGNYGTNNFATGLICVWCNSVWIGVILTTIYAFYPAETVWGCLPLALSTAAIAIDRYTGGV